jgi:hypothetical protein
MLRAATTVPLLQQQSEIIGNITLAGCLIVFLFIKTKNFLLSGYYVFFSVITVMLINTLLGVLLEYTINL